VAPGCAATEALFAVVLAQTLAGALMVAAGVAVTLTVRLAEPLQPFAFVTWTV
jgi:hypothetical protein